MLKMKCTFGLIKLIYFILSGLTNLITFIVVILCTNSNSNNFIEYTTLSKFFINLYTLVILILLLIHTIYPKIFYNFIAKNMNIMSSNKSKIAVYLILSSMYWSTDNIPYFLYAAISFVSTFGMMIFEIIFDCAIINGQENISEIIKASKNITNAIIVKDIEITSKKNKIDKKDEIKNENNNNEINNDINDNNNININDNNKNENINNNAISGAQDINFNKNIIDNSQDNKHDLI